MVGMARFLEIIDIRGGQKPATRYFSEESTKRTPGKNEGIDMLRVPLGAMLLWLDRAFRRQLRDCTNCSRE
jgi:hypothetical protein